MHAIHHALPVMEELPIIVSHALEELFWMIHSARQLALVISSTTAEFVRTVMHLVRHVMEELLIIVSRALEELFWMIHSARQLALVISSTTAEFV